MMMIHYSEEGRDGVKARSVKAKDKTKDFRSKAKTKAKDLSFKAKAKADNCQPRGASRSRPRPRGLHA